LISTGPTQWRSCILSLLLQQLPGWCSNTGSKRQMLRTGTVHSIVSYDIDERKSELQASCKDLSCAQVSENRLWKRNLFVMTDIVRLQSRRDLRRALLLNKCLLVYAEHWWLVLNLSQRRLAWLLWSALRFSNNWELQTSLCSSPLLLSRQLFLHNIQPWCNYVNLLQGGPLTVMWRMLLLPTFWTGNTVANS
jgi:hypothetical protein